MQQYFGEKKDKNKIYLFDEDINHIKNVMRLKVKEELLIVFDNTRYLCSLNDDYKSTEIIQELETNKNKNEYIVYIPLTVEEKMDLVFQKGTELGVTKFIPVEFENCKFKIKDNIKDKKLNRWRKIVKAASEQSHRFNIPKVNEITSVKNVKINSGVNIMCFLDKEGVKHIGKVLTPLNIHDTITLIYGPEGGISKSEEDYLESLGFIKTSLGNNILRTETVVIFVSSIIEYLKSGE